MPEEEKIDKAITNARQEGKFYLHLYKILVDSRRISYIDEKLKLYKIEQFSVSFWNFDDTIVDKLIQFFKNHPEISKITWHLPKRRLKNLSKILQAFPENLGWFYLAVIFNEDDLRDIADYLKTNSKLTEADIRIDTNLVVDIPVYKAIEAAVALDSCRLTGFMLKCNDKIQQELNNFNKYINSYLKMKTAFLALSNEDQSNLKFDDFAKTLAKCVTLIFLFYKAARKSAPSNLSKSGDKCLLHCLNLLKEEIVSFEKIFVAVNIFRPCLGFKEFSEYWQLKFALAEICLGAEKSDGNLTPEDIYDKNILALSLLLSDKVDSVQNDEKLNSEVNSLFTNIWNQLLGKNFGQQFNLEAEFANNKQKMLDIFVDVAKSMNRYLPPNQESVDYGFINYNDLDSLLEALKSSQGRNQFIMAQQDRLQKQQAKEIQVLQRSNQQLTEQLKTVLEELQKFKAQKTESQEKSGNSQSNTIKFF